MSDPRYTDPRQTDPVLDRDDSSGGVWGWVAGVAILALIAFVVIAGWNSDRNSASNSPATSTAQRTMPGPSTTGAGGTSPQPMSPAPSSPAPANRGTQ